MSGKYERDMEFDRKSKIKLESAPDVLTDYYYNLIGSGKSYRTAYNYICYIMNFINFIYKRCPNDFYLNIKPSHINKYISSLRVKTTNGEVKPTSDSFKTIHWSALNSFFQFLVPDYITSNPVASTQRPKMKDNPKVTYLTSEEISDVLK